MRAFQQVQGVILPMDQSNVDTDQVIPAHYLQKPRANDFGKFLFHGLRYRKDGSEAPAFVLNQPAYRAASILVAQRNFGCGSSREHAVWALCDYGFRAVVAPSFGDIFLANALKNGLLPVVLPAEVVAGLLEAALATPGASMAIDLAAQTVTGPDGAVHRFEIDPFPRQCLLQGLDEIDYTLSQAAHIAAFEKTHTQYS